MVYINRHVKKLPSFVNMSFTGLSCGWKQEDSEKYFLQYLKVERGRSCEISVVIWPSPRHYLPKVWKV
jgi:hypothetical protein